jgi:lipoprotein-releasing system permease protein
MNLLSGHLAWRYLRRHPRRRHLAVTTLVSVAGVALGVGALVIVMGVLSGLEGFIEESVITVDSPLSVFPDSGSVLYDGDSLPALLETLPEVAVASPFIQGEAILRMPSRGVDGGCRIRGVDPDREFSDGAMADRLSYGEMALTSPDGGNLVLMGLYLAEGFYHSLGDSIYLFPPKVLFSSRGHAVGLAVLGGAVETGLPVNDETLAYIDIELARRMYMPGGGISGISIRPAAGFSEAQTAEAVRAALPPGAVVKTWRELNPDLTASIKLERMGAFLAILLITLVATFNIIGTIARSAIERQTDISVLKAMGARNRLIFRIFLWEGVLVGALGVLIGLAIGLIGCWVIGSTNLLELPDVYSFHEHIPVRVSLGDTLPVAMVALLLSIVSGVLPAMKAARLDPVRGLRD